MGSCRWPVGSCPWRIIAESWREILPKSLTRPNTGDAPVPLQPLSSTDLSICFVKREKHWRVGFPRNVPLCSSPQLEPRETNLRAHSEGFGTRTPCPDLPRQSVVSRITDDRLPPFPRQLGFLSLFRKKVLQQRSAFLLSNAPEDRAGMI